MNGMPIISQEFTASHVTHEMMDYLLAQGWRHFGTQFFRYNVQLVGDAWQTIVPVRIRLADFQLSKSQRRVLRKNLDVTCSVKPAEITDDVRDMFQRHKSRFKDNIPDEISSFLSDTPSRVPGEGRMLTCEVDGQTVAVSFVDVGASSVSSIYGIFEPEHSSRSLGIFTLLKEIEHATVGGFDYHYPGYVTSGSSAYDYKKQFSALEGYDWQEKTWRPFEQFVPMILA